MKEIRLTNKEALRIFERINAGINGEDPADVLEAMEIIEPIYKQFVANLKDWEALKEQKKAEIEAKDKNKANGWIPATEEMPEKYVNVYATLRDKNDGYIFKSTYMVTDRYEDSDYEILAWQSLPQDYVM